MLIFCLCLFQVLEHASVCLTRIAEAFASSPEKLDELCNHGLVAQAAGLVSVSNSAGQASLSTLTYTVCFSFTFYYYTILFMIGLLTFDHIILEGSNSTSVNMRKWISISS